MHGTPYPQPAGLGEQGLCHPAAAGDHDAGVRVRAADLAQAGDEVLHALLPLQPAEEQQQRRAVGRVARPCGAHLRCRHPPAVRFYAVVQDGDLLGIQVEQDRRLVSHGPRAGDHLVGAVGQPPFHRVDLLVERQGEPAAVPAGLGGMHRGDQRCAGGVGDRDRGVRDQPVVGVHHVGSPAVQQPQRRADHGMAHAERPGHQVAGELEVRRVLRHPQHPHPVDDGLCRRVRGRVGAVRLPAQHDDVVTLPGQPHRQFVHVPAEPAYDDRRILPGHHQYPHGR